MVPRLRHGVLAVFPRAAWQGALAEMSGKGSGARNFSCKLSMRVSTAQARRDWRLNRGHVERCRFTSVLFWFFEPCPPRVAGMGDPGHFEFERLKCRFCVAGTGHRTLSNSRGRRVAKNGGRRGLI